MDWDQWSGQVISLGNVVNSNAESRAPYLGVCAYTSSAGVSQGVSYTPTVGGPVILDFGIHIQLVEQWLSPGSLGQFHLKVAVDVQNTDLIPWNANQYELVIVPMNSGIWVNERGASSVFSGLLVKQDVLDASEQQEPYSRGAIKRMIGGGFLDSLKSGLSWITSKLPMVKQVLQHIPHEYSQKSARVLDALGYGKHAKKLDNRIM
jgi:hypothetical protein